MIASLHASIKDLSQQVLAEHKAQLSSEQADVLNKALEQFESNCLNLGTDTRTAISDLVAKSGSNQVPCKLTEPVDRELAEEVAALDTRADVLSEELVKKREMVPKMVEHSLKEQLQKWESSAIEDAENANQGNITIPSPMKVDASHLESLKEKFAKISEKVNHFAETVPKVVDRVESVANSAETVLAQPETATDKVITAPIERVSDTTTTAASLGNTQVPRSKGTILAKRLAQSWNQSNKGDGVAKKFRE